MMTKNIIIVVLLLLVGVLTGISYDQTIRIDAYDRYNRDCEILLDSIASWNNTFEDGIAETDTYTTYLESREHLDSLICNK